MGRSLISYIKMFCFDVEIVIVRKFLLPSFLSKVEMSDQHFSFITRHKKWLVGFQYSKVHYEKLQVGRFSFRI